MEVAAVAQVERARAEWIEPTFRFTQGMDPLGLRALTAGRIVSRLTPGVLALSDRARYVSFYLWLLKRYADQHRPLSNQALGRYILAREYEYGLAVRLCPRRCPSSPMGMRRVSPAVAARPAAFGRGESVESPMGGYGLYYRSPMLSLGLVRPPGTLLGEETITLDVLNRGNSLAVDLAEAFAAGVAETEYLRTFIDGDADIPHDVLVEYASRACLCRLDEFAEERGLLRTVYFANTDQEPPIDIARRREAFALVLELLGSGAMTSGDDESFRRAVWRAHASRAGQDGARTATLDRWAALTAINVLQDGINLLWIGAGGSLRRAAPSGGLDSVSIRTILGELAEQAPLATPGGEIAVGAARDLSAFTADIAVSTAAAGLVAMLDWARADRRPIAGVALIAAVLGAIPGTSDASAAWAEVAAVNGDWQPGLAVVSGRCAALERDGATLGDMVVWLTEYLVLRAHENNAYSKLPDFTFRWRWEAGRLHFYDHPLDWDELGDLRSRSITRLALDLGLLEMGSGGTVVTADGSRVIEEAFG